MIQKSWPFARLLALSAFLALGYTPAQAQDQDQAPDPASQEAAEIEAAAELRDEIDIGNGWTRATPGGATNAAVYLEIENENEQEVRLIQVTSAN
ncbi:MAG: copper chaperone PCu(A)C, partial [Proteobacteria bacterium]|nr:copper chaperone PCu(A)C [Pseudomonadota bacterium]